MGRLFRVLLFIAATNLQKELKGKTMKQKGRPTLTSSLLFDYLMSTPL